MTTREKIAHLYRRFGFGISPEDLDVATKLGLDAAIKTLIDYPELPDVTSPHEFTWRDKDEVDLGAYVYRLWWVHEMIVTKTPLREKLAMFWHSHFAVSDNKVEDGPMMLQYLQTIRANADGKFSTLLNAVSKDPAMMKYLDMQRSLRGNPNENFAREVMELFTLGIGNYTEKDVQEVARALTGWGYNNFFWEMPGTSTAKLKDAIKYERPFSAFTYMPSMHDPSPKTIFGKTGPYTGDDVLGILANHPVTARRNCLRLWEYFAYSGPDEGTIGKLVAAYKRSGGEVKEVLRTMARLPEFYSSQCVRQLTKSPADFVIPIARTMGLGRFTTKLRSPKADAYTRIPQPVLDNLWGIADRMDKAGLSLLYPTDVSGWKWDKGWISPAAMVERYQFRGVLIWGEKGPGEGSKRVMEFIKSRSPKTSADMANLLCELFDVNLPEASRKTLTAKIDTVGGVESIKHEDWWPNVTYHSLGMLFAAPETHLA